MIKAIALTLVYAVAVSMVMNHFFNQELIESISSGNNNSGHEMVTILSCVPGVWFIMDYFQNRDNSPE